MLIISIYRTQDIVFSVEKGIVCPFPMQHFPYYTTKKPLFSI